MNAAIVAAFILFAFYYTVLHVINKKFHVLVTYRLRKVMLLKCAIATEAKQM